MEKRLKKYAIIVNYDKELAQKVQEFLFKHGFGWGISLNKELYSLNAYNYTINRDVKNRITHGFDGYVYNPSVLDKIFKPTEFKEFCKAVKNISKPIKESKWKRIWKQN